MALAAIGPRLARRIPAARHEDPHTLHRRLVTKLPAELEQADIGHNTREPAVRHHAVHVEVFDANDIGILTMAVVVLCSASCRMLAIRACSRASLLADFCPVADPLTLRLWDRDNRRSRFGLDRSALGPSMVLPSLSVARAFTPRSMPPIAWFSQELQASIATTLGQGT